MVWPYKAPASPTWGWGEHRICVTESCGVNPLFWPYRPPSVSDMWVVRTPNLRYGIVRCETFVLVFGCASHQASPIWGWGVHRICVTESCGVNPLFLQCKPPNVSDMWVGRTPNLRYGIVRRESVALATQGVVAPMQCGNKSPRTFGQHPRTSSTRGPHPEIVGKICGQAAQGVVEPLHF